jgi:hypothetical protein
MMIMPILLPFAVVAQAVRRATASDKQSFDKESFLMVF